jgi:uridine phosphorylase
VLGKVIHRPAKLDQKLCREILALADPSLDPYDTITGKTMCTHDFYEGERRHEGFIKFMVI